MEDWYDVCKKMNVLDISLVIVGVDFDDPTYPYEEPDKSTIKRKNEEFYHTLINSLNSGIVGTCAFALQEIMRPDIRNIKSALMATVLRIGDTGKYPDETIEIPVKTSKTTAIVRPKGWKKFAPRKRATKMEVDGADTEGKAEFVQLKMRTEYYVDRSGNHVGDEDEDVKMEDNENLLDGTTEDSEKRSKHKEKGEHLEKVEKEDLIKGFKYGTTYVPCPDGQFPRLPTRKGIEICGFFPTKNFRREYVMGEIMYVWAEPTSPQQQAAISSIVQAIYQKGSVAITRLVTKDDMDAKMGLLYPTVFEKVDCFLWAQMPFADDVRRYSFPSLERLVSKKGEVLTSHPYLPTGGQQEAMDSFVDAMDLMDAGDKDEEGNRQPWFDPRLSYNPSLHRIKQALLHCAVVPDINKYPLPPPHPELLKYFGPPHRVTKRAKVAIEECKDVFKVRQVPKKVPTKAKIDGHAHAEEDDGKLLLLDPKLSPGRTQSQAAPTQTGSPSRDKGKSKAINPDDSETEDDSDDFVLVEKYEERLLDKKPIEKQHGRKIVPFPTPAKPQSPSAQCASLRGGMDVGEVNLEVDPGRAPGRIIGTTFPLKDFRKNLAHGDTVNKAVEDMGHVIGEIVTRPFAWRRTDEIMECLKEMRDVALQEDEVDAWNTFMEGFKKNCLGKGSNKDFWEEIKKAGRRLSLISDTEASQYGGTSTASEDAAKQFLA
ncbi:hypothetical protein AX15_005654 [Amanita polypyramis BW_CC]|nr:hypothetical protein AX15_005654 [Amanita polypyramis BW_CC]